MTLRAKKSLLVIVTGALIAGCGSGDEGTIPGGDADNLTNLLDAVEDAVAAQDCESAQENADQFVTAVDNLPSEVDDQVKDGLREAGARMTELSRDPDQCETETGASGPGGAEDPTPPPTEEEPVEEEPEEEPPEEDEPAPEDDEEEAPDQGNQGEGGGGGSEQPPAEEPATELEVEPGTDTGGINPGERRAP